MDKWSIAGNSMSKSSKGKKRIRRAVCAAAALVLTVSMAFTSLAFYQTPKNKKGLTVSGIGSSQTVRDLNASQAIWSARIQDFATGQVGGEDALFAENKREGITNTVVMMNPWDAHAYYPELFTVSDPGSAVLFGYNVNTDEGRATLKSLAEKWAAHYKNTVSNWIIGNEVNDGNTWNYSPTQDLTAYTTEYCTGFRIWYDAIKAANPDAHVLIPFDYRWNWRGGNGAGYYQAKDMMTVINSELKDTDYGIAWHAYPEDLLNPDFRNDPDAVDSPDTPIINMKNIHVLTDYMQQPEYLSPAGQVRHIILSEQGFNCTDPALQAECIAAAYSIANANPYIDAFFITREQDTGESYQGQELHNGLKDGAGNRRPAYDAYKNAN